MTGKELTITVEQLSSTDWNVEELLDMAKDAALLRNRFKVFQVDAQYLFSESVDAGKNLMYDWVHHLPVEGVSSIDPAQGRRQIYEYITKRQRGK